MIVSSRTVSFFLADVCCDFEVYRLIHYKESKQLGYGDLQRATSFWVNCFSHAGNARVFAGFLFN